MTGFGFYELDQWGVVRNEVSNPEVTDARALVAVQFAAMPTVQYAADVWLPPRSRREVFTPVRPLREGLESNAFAVNAQLIGADDAGRERLLSTSEGLLLKLNNPVKTAAILSSDDRGPGDTFAALREANGLKPTVFGVTGRSAPALPGAWHAIDTLLVAHPNIDFDPAQIDAMRQWVFSGGRLWIMLDRVDPAFVSRLLGKAWDVAVLDRVPITQFSLDYGDRQDERRFDYPIDFVRVSLPTGYEVTHSIDGYPAGFRKQVGSGTLVVTTVASPAWLTEEGTATDALKQLNDLVRRRTAETQPDTAMLDGYVREQIGYQIIGRTPVAVVLGLFAGLILIVGVVLARRGRLEWLAAGGAVLSVLAAGALIGAGLARQGRTPTTVAQAQVARVDPDQSNAQVAGLMSVYTAPNDTGTEATILARNGAVVWPDLAAQGGGLLRLVWTDGDHYRLQNLNMPGGAVRSVRVSNQVVFDDPPRATVTFDDDGMVGWFDAGQIGTLEDTLVVTGNGHVAPRETEGGSWLAGDEQVLADDQFVAADLLNQTQMARQEVYRQLIRPGFIDRPMLLGWGPALQIGADYTEDATDRGAVIAVIPIDFTRPEPGARIALPAPFLRMGPFRGARGLASATIYNSDTGEWVGNVQQEMAILMRFDPPEALVPMTLESARYTFNLKAPGRSYEVISFADGRLRTLANGENALGRTTVELTGDDLPSMSEDGAVLIGLKIGPYIDPVNARPWTLLDMDLAVTGVIPHE